MLFILPVLVIKFWKVVMVVYLKHNFEVSILCFAPKGTLTHCSFIRLNSLWLLWDSFQTLPFWQPFPTNVLQDHISPLLPWLITRSNAINYAKNHIFYNSQDSHHIKLHSHNFSKVQISNLSLVLFLAKSEILHVKTQDKWSIKALTGSEFLKMRRNNINCFLETLSTDEYLKNLRKAENQVLSTFKQYCR